MTAVGARPSPVRWAALLGIALLVASSLPGGVVPGVRAAEYTLETEAAYEVVPAERQVSVAIAVTFTNTTPDPEGQFSVFEEVKLAVHDEATEVSASDDDGALEVSVAVEDEVNVATVDLRDGLRFEETATFEVSYTLPDSDDPHLRVRPSAVVFPAWSFGTAGTVRVAIPVGYEVRVDGDPLTEDGGALTSGPIEDPSRWLALVTAVQPADYVELDAAVPLGGGTADLRVRAFSDDEAWGQRTLDLLVEALPRIEEAVGLPYPEIGQLVVTEAVAVDGSGFGEDAAGGNEIRVAFDQPPFTVLHQVAHVWVSPTIAEGRWIREGLASDVAARVAADLDVELPFDPVARAQERADAAFPLDTWSANAGPEGEAYGYAASWAFFERLEEAVGREAIALALRRVAGSIGPYESVQLQPEPVSETVAPPAVPLTTRSLLDQLETAAGEAAAGPLAELFAASVLTEGDAALLPERADARAAFRRLVERGDSWAAPDPVRGALTAWDFATARQQIDDALAWLEDRDALLADMRRLGLSAPERLQQAYRSYGGGPEAEAELERERAVVEAYAEAASEATRERSFLERVGLIGGPDPEAQLARANGHFGEGDLPAAVAAIGEAERIMAAAELGGIVRVVSAVLVALLVLGLAILLVRRRSSYTARR